MSILLNRLSLFPHNPHDSRGRFRRVWLSIIAFALALIVSAICAPRAHAQRTDPTGLGAFFHNAAVWTVGDHDGFRIYKRTVPGGFVDATGEQSQASFDQAVQAAGAAPAETPSIKNIYGIGLSANPGQSPSVSGTAMYGHDVTGKGTYTGAILDILPQTVKPIVVNTNIGAFVAQEVATVAGVPLFTMASTGISVGGSNTGWNWTSGGAAFFKLPKPNWFVVANVRVSKSSVSGATDYQLIPGVQLAWGN